MANVSGDATLEDWEGEISGQTWASNSTTNIPQEIIDRAPYQRDLVTIDNDLSLKLGARRYLIGAGVEVTLSEMNYLRDKCVEDPKLREIIIKFKDAISVKVPWEEPNAEEW